MVALTRYLHVFASRVTTRLSAILFSVWYCARAWDVRALSCLLIRHYNSVLSRLLRQSLLSCTSLRSPGSGTYTRSGGNSLPPGGQFSAAASSRLLACSSPKVTS